MNKTTTGSQDTTRIDEAVTGNYSLSGTEGTTSTAIESANGGGWDSYTEILTDSATESEQGNSNFGEYTLVENGTRTSSFDDEGGGGGGVIAYTISESTTGSYNRTTTVDESMGETIIEATTNTDYTLSQESITSLEVNYVISETGQENGALLEVEDTVTGDYSQFTDGSDSYTLCESGHVNFVYPVLLYSQQVTGSENYGTGEQGNLDQQTSTMTSIGSGTYTRVSSASAALASGSGDYGYTLQEIGNAAAGQFTQNESGTDRYGLVDRFDNVSNSASGKPGNISYNANGVPFTDPPVKPEVNVEKAPEGSPIIITSSGDPITGKSGATLWAVTFTLSETATATKDRKFIMQHIVRTGLIEQTRYAEGDKKGEYKKGELLPVNADQLKIWNTQLAAPKPVEPFRNPKLKDFNGDPKKYNRYIISYSNFWELFEFKKGSTLSSNTISSNDEGVKDVLGKDEVRLTLKEKIDGTDWFLVQRYPNTKGEITITGELYLSVEKTNNPLGWPWKKYKPGDKNHPSQAGNLTAAFNRNLGGKDGDSMDSWITGTSKDAVLLAIHTLKVSWDDGVDAEKITVKATVVYVPAPKK